MALPRIPPASARILRALCDYHFLNNHQMVQLGISSSIDSLGVHALPPLAPPRDKSGLQTVPRGKKPSDYLCGTYRYSNSDPQERGTKQPYVYYLAPAGLDYAQCVFGDELEQRDIWAPSEIEALSNDFFHRRDYVAAHIHLRQWADAVGAEIDFFTHYYQGDPRHRGRGRPPSVNRLDCHDRHWKTATPDGLLGITHQGRSRLFVLELHRRTDTRKVVEQIYRNFKSVQAINARFADYPTDNDPFMLSVFSDRDDMRLVQKMVRDTTAFDPMVLKGLLFTSLDMLNESFAGAWAYADAKVSAVFS